MPYATLSIFILFFILFYVLFFSTCPYLYICNSCIFVYVYIYIYIYTVGTESIQTPLNFSLFVILQPFAKII